MEATKLTQDTLANTAVDITIAPSTPKKAASTSKSTTSKKSVTDTAISTSTKNSASAEAGASSEVDSANVSKKKTNETDGYKKIQLMINTAKEETIEELHRRSKKDLKEVKDSILVDLQEIKDSIAKKSSNDNGSSLLTSIADLLSKLNDLNTKMAAANEKQEFNFNWLTIALDSVLHKNDIDLDVKPVIKGEVKTVKKAPAKAKVADSAAAVDLSTIKSTNFLKHQVLHDAEYILQLFNNKDNEDHITNCICGHIKALPIASTFNKDARISEKVEFFINYVKSNETTSTKLFTLLNKNTAFKKIITSNFESWKAQNTVNVNKDFLGEEDA